MLGGSEVGEVVVDSDLAGDDLLEHILILLDAPVLERPGIDRQADSALRSAHGHALVAVVLSPGSVVSGGQSKVSGLADALEGGGDNGVGREGLVNVNADNVSVVGSSRSGDGVEDGAAAGEDALGAVPEKPGRKRRTARCSSWQRSRP